MKITTTFYLFSILIIGSFKLQAQTTQPSNAVDVQAIISPNNGEEFNTLDTFDIVARIKNEGPNDLLAGDQFKISYSVGDGGPNSRDFDTIITVGSNRNMVVGEGRTYTIATDFIVNGNNYYATCVSVTGTNLYPVNTVKNPSECVQFVVSIPENKLEIETVYYADNEIHLNLNRSENVIAQIFNISGKELLNVSINSKTNKLSFKDSAKGFYFIKLSGKYVRTTTAKFVIN